MIEMVMRTPRLLPILFLLLSLPACHREKGEPVIGTGYVSSNAINLRDRLGPQQITVVTLQQGEKLDILQRKRTWLRVRTAGGKEGWLEQRNLVTQEIYDQFAKLRQT